MTTAADVPGAMQKVLERFNARQTLFWSLSASLFGSALLLRETPLGMGFLFAATSIATLGLMMVALSWRQKRRAVHQNDLAARIIEQDSQPAILSDAQGKVVFANQAACDVFSTSGPTTVMELFGSRFADHEGRVRSLLRATERGGSKRTEVVTTRKGSVEIHVLRLGPDSVLWRLSEVAENRPAADYPEHGIGLPMFSCDCDGNVSRSNQLLDALVGRSPLVLEDVVVDLPVRTGEEHVLKTIHGSQRHILLETEAPDGGRDVFVLPQELGISQQSDWQFFDALPVPMLKIGRTGDVLLANRLARDLLAHRAPLGAHLSDLVEGLGRSITDWLADATDGHGLNRTEVIRAIHPPKDVYLQITLGRIEDDGETALVAVLNDATELKSLEAQFVQSQKMQAIGQLAGGVAHDFNNLLTAISGHCDLMLLRHDETDPDYADLIQVHQNANRAASLVGQLLAFSRKQQLQLELVDLRETMSDLTHLLNRLVGEKVQLTLDHDSDLQLVRADKRQIEQVIMNLVVNARDAMPDGGSILIETRGEYLSESLVRDRVEVPAGDYVVVRVSDEGVGIPPENLAKVFEPFWSTKRTGEGTGLGLSTAYGIVKQTGGFIFADSTLNEGTVFTIYLQARTAPDELSQPEVVSAEASNTAPKGGVVLLVEDEAPVRAFASRALKMQGFDVIEADSAEAALKVLEDETLWVDAFVTDVIMPGMDGPTWVRKALKQRPETKVVFVSGYAEDAISESQSRIPNAVFLPKPFSLNDLTSTVQSQLS